MIKAHNICILLIFSIFTVLFAKPSVTIDSLSGIAQIQRAGAINWEKLTKEAKLYDNDMVRIPDEGIVILRWPGGTQTYVHKKTQVLINLYKNKNDKSILSNATVMFGAALFIVKKILPKDDSEEMRVYTPTAVLSIRGTSFLVDVDSIQKFTTVKMLNGIISVKNIVKNISIILGTPYQTTIPQNEYPSTPKAVLQEDLDSLKSWIPESVIEREILDQIDNSKQERINLVGNYQERCLISQFTNTSSYIGPWKIEKEITRQFATLLRNKLSSVVVMVSDSSHKETNQVGKNLNTRFCISGNIESFELNKHAEISVHGDEYRESIIAKVCISISLKDLSNNKELIHKSFCAEISGKNIQNNNWNILQRNGFNLDNTTFKNTIIGKAVMKSLLQTVTSAMNRIE